MFPYTVKDTESESDIQNNNLLYKIRPKLQNTFEILETFEKIELEILFYYMYNFHNSNFVFL